MGNPATTDGERWTGRHRLILAVIAALAVGIAGVALAKAEPWTFTLGGLVTLAGPAIALATKLSRRSQALVVAATLLAQSVLLISLFGGELRAQVLALCLICVIALYEDAIAMAVTVAASTLLIIGLAITDPTLLDLPPGDPLEIWMTVLLGSLVTAVAATAVATLWSDARRAATAAADHARSIETYLEVAGSMLIVLDREARVVSANRQTCLVMELELESIVGQNWLELSVPDALLAESRELYREVLDSDQVQPVYEGVVIAATGEERLISWYSTARRDAEGEIVGMVCSGTDITEQRAAQLAVERSRLELESLRRMAQKVASLDDAREAIVTAAKQLVGATAVGIAEPSSGDVITYTVASNPDHVGLEVPLTDAGGRVSAAFLTGQAQFAANMHEGAQVNTVLRDRTGMVAVLHQPIIGASGTLGVLSVAWDHVVPSIASRQAELVGLVAHEAAIALRRRESVEALARAALVDSLTGIANRRAFDAELPQALRRAEEGGWPFSLIVMDLNEFKAVNDLQGHEAGDRVLIAAADAWAGVLRSGDLLARLGGDEFTVLLPTCDERELAQIAERLRAATPHAPGTSIGGAVWDGREPAASLIRRADEAQYADKAESKRGRGGRRRTGQAPPTAPASGRLLV